MEPPGQRYVVSLDSPDATPAADVYLADRTDEEAVEEAVRAAVTRIIGEAPSAVRRASDPDDAGRGEARFEITTSRGDVVAVLRRG